MIPITPELVLRAYACGVFPMARTREGDSVVWVDPRQRGIIPLQGFHVPRSLRRVLRREVFRVTLDIAFAEVLEGCAEPAPDRPDTWINSTIRDIFLDLHARGFAHSVEVWRGGRLAGGLYGLALGGAFFGESMFSRQTDASKVALCHLVARMKAGGYTLLDTQYVNDHLLRFGAIEVPRAEYHRMLEDALSESADLYSLGPDSGEAVLSVLSQEATHTS